MGASPKQGRVAVALQVHMLAVRPEMVIFVCLNQFWEKIKWKEKKNDAKFTGHYEEKVPQFSVVFRHLKTPFFGGLRSLKICSTLFVF